MPVKAKRKSYMPKVINYGSLNIDLVFRVGRIVAPGETIAAFGFERHAGGKGANQSVALARAGATVSHVGRVGADGGFLLAQLQQAGVDIALSETGAEPTGQAIVQVADGGENAIVVNPGANHSISAGQREQAAAAAGPGDWLLLQNEVNGNAEMLALAKSRGLKVCLNPAPFTEAIHALPMADLDVLILNEVEARALAGVAEPEAAFEMIASRHPGLTIVMTLGARGAVCATGSARYACPAPAVKALDTTAAGDTFIGYFLAARLRGEPLERALREAVTAAAITVTRKGAIPSIPHGHELRAALAQAECKTSIKGGIAHESRL